MLGLPLYDETDSLMNCLFNVTEKNMTDVNNASQNASELYQINLMEQNCAKYCWHDHDFGTSAQVTHVLQAY